MPRPVLERVAALAVRTLDGCLTWQGSVRRDDGRPQMMVGSTADGTRSPQRVHRVVWQEHYGPPPEGYDIHHRCENKLCVDIDHLVLLPHGDHSRHHAPPGSDRARTRVVRAMHVRWHVNRGIVKDDCPHCRGR